MLIDFVYCFVSVMCTHHLAKDTWEVVVDNELAEGMQSKKKNYINNCQEDKLVHSLAHPCHK